MKQPRWSISILCHNRLEMTQRCLASVLEHSPPNIEVIVTDNGSDAKMSGWLSRLPLRDPRCVVRRNTTNEGVIIPKNRALAVSHAPYFVSLDNDCLVGPGWLQKLTDPIEDLAGIVQVGRQAGFGTLSPKGVGHRGSRLDYIDGSCFVVRADIARRYGLCDEAFEFAYCEDSDFSLRIRKAGWRIAVADAGVRHGEHGTASGMDLRRYWEKNHRLMMNRWGGYMRSGGTFGHPGEPDVPPRREVA